jgi:transglutaminase-like putative cysteine protease
MIIRIGFDIALRLPAATAIVFVLRVHPSRQHDVIEGEHFTTTPPLEVEEYLDVYGNLCGRVNVEAGVIRFQNIALVRDSGELDACDPGASEHDVREMPVETLSFVLASRYCEVDSELLDFAWNTFGHLKPGWGRVSAICDFVYNHLTFNYLQARVNRTALDAYHERVGVCRDFAHLAITLCRCLNIPARYVTGYLGDIGVPPVPDPMDFSAWFEAYLGDRWYTFDARHNARRIGRIVIAQGRDAGDVPITMVFGKHTIEHFKVVTEEVC